MYICRFGLIICFLLAAEPPPRNTHPLNKFTVTTTSKHRYSIHTVMQNNICILYAWITTVQMEWVESMLSPHNCHDLWIWMCHTKACPKVTVRLYPYPLPGILPFTPDVLHFIYLHLSFTLYSLPFTVIMYHLHLLFPLTQIWAKVWLWAKYWLLRSCPL